MRIIAQRSVYLFDVHSMFIRLSGTQFVRLALCVQVVQLVQFQNAVAIEGGDTNNYDARQGAPDTPTMWNCHQRHHTPLVKAMGKYSTGGMVPGLKPVAHILVR